MLYGAFIGDMVGVPYEFLPCKDRNFKMFTHYSRYSDDTIMTVAVADAMLQTIGYSEEDTLPVLEKTLQEWGKKYPGAGYGSAFGGWIYQSNPKPYNSWGNGSAMRVSSVAWLYNTLEEVEEKAKWTAEITHNHPEGIKGAQATAAAIFLARTGHSKKEIKSYIEEKYGYNLHRTCKEIRKSGYRFEVSCQKSVPESIICFLEGKDFEDTIRNAVFLNGDADTMACIAGAIAEAFYGVPDEFIVECRSRLTQECVDVVNRCERYNENPSGREVSKPSKLKLFLNKLKK